MAEKILDVTVPSMSDKPTGDISSRLAHMNIGRREEITSVTELSSGKTELGIGVEWLSSTSKSSAEMVCRVTDLRLCLEDCDSDGRTDKLTSCTMNTWHAGKQCALVHSCAWTHSRAQRFVCHKDTKLFKNSNLITMTGPVEANQEEQVGKEPWVVVEDGVSMVEDFTGKSQEMLLPRRRLRSPQVTENLVDTLSGPSNQSSSQGELSVGKVVGQRMIARQEGMVSTKSRLHCKKKSG